MLELDGLLGDVDLEGVLDGVWWRLECSRDNLPGGGVPADSMCVGPYGDGAWCCVERTIPVCIPTGALSRLASLPLSVDVRELADLRLT